MSQAPKPKGLSPSPTPNLKGCPQAQTPSSHVPARQMQRVPQVPALNPKFPCKPKGLSPSPTPKPQVPMSQPQNLKGRYLFWMFFLFFFLLFFLFLVPWSSNPLVPWSSRPPSSRPLIVWSLVPWSSGPLVLWSPAPLVPCSSGLLVSWSSVLFRSFFSNLSFTLFYYQFYIFTLSCVC